MSMVGTPELAIVIPAYKSAYLERTLKSISEQTDQRYKVYICDDASPWPIQEIVGRCGLPTDRVVYHRFESNLGRRSLAQHWDRCIRLSKEPWVWLFSDDDIMEHLCVEAFYQTLCRTNGSHDIYRFDTAVIDGADKIVSLSPPNPDVESWDKLAYFVLRGLRLIVQQSLVFRRTAYEKIGGFLDWPNGWHSDCAFAIACATNAGICTVRPGRVLFRQAGLNISSTRSWDNARFKRAATARFVEWLLQHIRQNPLNDFPGVLQLESLARNFFFAQLRAMIKPIGMKETKNLLPFMQQTLGMSTLVAYGTVLHYDLSWFTERVRQTILEWLNLNIPRK
ncbi:MAG: glycosyltransferase family A protein [Candidatus Methanomethylicaceae archaeon]